MGAEKAGLNHFGLAMATLGAALAFCLTVFMPAGSAFAQELSTAGLSTDNIETQAVTQVYINNSNITVQPIPDVVYTGTAHTPEPVLLYNGAVLKKGTDYIVDSYYANVNAGNASVWVKGINGFYGSRGINFTIKQASINSATMTVGDQAYTGYLIEPAIDASFDGVELRRYTDYRVTFKNNRYIGTAEALITGNGNFVGTRTLTFNILPAANRLAVVAKSKTVKVTGTARSKQVIYGSSAYRFSGYDGKLSYKKGKVSVKGAAAKKAAKKIKVNKKTGAITIPKGAPKATYKLKVKITASGDEGHNPATKTITLKIKVK